MTSVDHSQAKAGDGDSSAALPPRLASSGLWLRVALPIGAAVVTGAVVAAVLSTGTASGRASELSLVPVAQVDDASATLDRGVAAQMTADAKSCKTPMAFVTLSANAENSSPVRIRSGNYLSPAIAVNASPVRIAIPFPAPYLTGKGVISVEGQGQGVAVALTPGWKSDVSGSATINVIWTPKKAC